MITREAIRLPEVAQGCQVIASVSGGKDSTALILALREAQIPAIYVFADTGWEAPETYEYLAYLESTLTIMIHRVSATPKSQSGGYTYAPQRAMNHMHWSAMVDRIRLRAGFPGRMQRFCTRELKLEPLRAYHDRVEEETGKETVSAMGVRAQESARRSQMPEWEDEGPKYTRERWGGYVWRPLIQWTVEDVLLIHRRHAVKVNPLYQRGHDRVGCYPCIFSNKEEIRLIAQDHPERIEQIEALEAEMVALRQERNALEPGRYAHPEAASFFQTQSQGFTGIRKVVDWARTDHGGKQMQLLAPAPRGGCMKWGLCDLPSGDTTGTTPSPEVARYFVIEFDGVSFSIVAHDEAHAIECLRTYYTDAHGFSSISFEEVRSDAGDPCIVELAPPEAATKMLFDDARGGGSFAFTTFEIGAVASSEY